MLSLMLESAARSLTLGIAVWLSLRLFRIRAPESRSLAWTAVLLSAATMPLLVKIMDTVMARVPPSTLAWIPASPLLRPLAAIAGPTPAASFDWIELATLAYLLVAILFLLRLAAGLWRSLELWRRARPVHESWARGCDVRTSDKLAIPVTFGSSILLPPDWTSWDAFKRDAVLLHEQSHVRRRDFYLHLLARLHRAVFWFSPLAWWLPNQLLELAEAASDDAAVRKLGDPVSYAALLLEFAKKGLESGFMGVAMARGKTVEHRVERMLREGPIRPGASLLQRVLLICAAVPLTGMAAAAWTARAELKPAVLPLALPRQAIPAPAQQPAPQAGGEGYLARWPEQEVPDIIAAEEQSAFQNLRTDEEREHFIEEFWLRRDPTPGTSENEFRNEYIRRIAQANAKYTTATLTGWRTDRGRVLVKFGPPDELETHAYGDPYGRQAGRGAPANPPPYERWRYRFIEGLGNNIILEFVDLDRDGNYRLDYDRRDQNIVNTNPQGILAPRSR